MSCGDDLKTLLSRYVDGELGPEERTHVDEHVAACVPCRELLQIFQKNESLLSNALSTESFGNTVIENVINEIKRDGDPADAKPFVEVAEVSRFRAMAPLAAAALIAVGLVGILALSYNREMSSLQDRIGQMKAAQQDLSERMAANQAESNRLITSMRVEEALRRAPEGSALSAFITPQHLVVRASFDPKLYGAFSVYRHAEGEGDDKFAKLNTGRLDSPEFTDVTVKPAQGYVYKFRAYRSSREDDFVESLPIVMRVPRVQEVAPEKGVRVQCVDIAVTHKLAKFVLTRIVNGKAVNEEFLAKPGERLGEVRDLPGLGNVDFRTHLTLDRLEDGNQTLEVNYTRALLDSNGQPIMESISKDGKVEVKTERVDGVLSIRPNLRAFFRTVGAQSADVSLWKGSWIQVRAAE